MNHVWVLQNNRRGGDWGYPCTSERAAKELYESFLDGSVPWVEIDGYWYPHGRRDVYVYRERMFDL
jgi:hypothetical protein